MIRSFLARLVPRTRNGRIVALIAAIPIALFVLLMLIFGLDRFIHRGEVVRNVTMAGQSLSGLDEEGVRLAVLEVEAELVATPALFIVNDREFVLEPSRVGLSIDADAVVETAMETGRQGGPIRRLGDWFDQLRDETEIPLTIEINQESLDVVFDEWEEQAIEAAAFNGAVRIVDDEVVPEYPTKGLAIERETASGLVEDTLATPQRPTTVIPLVVLEPELTDADIDAAAAEAELALSGPAVLSSPSDSEISATFRVEQLRSAFDSSYVDEPEPALALSFDVEVIDQFLGPLRTGLEQPPQDADFQINDDLSVTLVPARTGTLLESEAVAQALYAAALKPSRRGDLPIVEGAEPEFTTEEAEAMMPLELVSEFTTNHSCCQNRVENIHRFADIVDRMVVQPGETFSLNEAVGQRTTELGFVPAPMIESGELTDSVGGGVSQFATTFYNAVFWGGYEDIEHTPHSIYISRYPELFEATISWPQPNLKFRNDSDAIIIIDTSYSDTSITVRFFGNNGGLTVESELFGRSNFTEARKRVEVNDAVPPTEERVISGGSQGWTVSGKRIITYPDGTVVEEDLVHRYRGELRVIQIHSCVANGTECPLLVPAVTGADLATAQATAAASGFSVVAGAPTAVTAESGQGGVVVSQTPEAGSYHLAGTVITVSVGEAPALPPPPPDPPPTTVAPPPPTTVAPPPPTTAPPP
jgi:vancomycin resistance protein YoaR